jgi:hypothetical protein
MLNTVIVKITFRFNLFNEVFEESEVKNEILEFLEKTVFEFFVLI